MKGCVKEVTAGKKYRIIYDVPSVDGKRRQKTETIYGGIKVARTALAERLVAVRNNKFIDSRNITVQELFERFLEANAPNLAATTLQRYQGYAANQINPTLGRVVLSQLRPLHLQQAYVKWSESLAGLTVGHCHRLIHRVLDQAMKWQLVSNNVADAVEPPKADRKEMRSLTESEVAQLLATLENANDHVVAQGGLSTESAFQAAVKFMLYTGTRRGECLGLKWDDVDLESGTVAIRRSLQETKDGVFFKPPKTKKSRRLEITKSLVAVLKSHKAAQNSVRLALGNGYKDEGLVFTRPDGSPIRPQTITQAFKALTNRCKIKGVRLHDLRHTHATLLIKGGVHPKIASSRLGHSAVGITLDLYSHVLPGMDREAAERFEQLIQNGNTQAV